MLCCYFDRVVLVSFVSLNVDCTRLLVGHVRGQIVMWDMTSGKVLRTITNVHRPGISVLRVRFTEDRTLALSNDSTGSVFLLEFKRLIGVRTCDFQCLFSGSRGEVHFLFLILSVAYLISSITLNKNSTWAFQRAIIKGSMPPITSSKWG